MPDRFPLSRDQEEAASFLHGRLVITAGPGSGKTRVVVERIRRLLEITHPDEILALTFTNKAANELEERIGRKLGYVGTIHGFAHLILSSYPDAKHALGPRFGVLSEWDRRDLLERAIAETASLVALGPLADYLAQIHARGLEPKGEVTGFSNFSFIAERVRKAYEATKARYVVEDFDGLIDRARLLLMANPLVLRIVRDRLRHVSIDEAQDLDRAQEDLLELVCPQTSCSALPAENRSLVLVGDPLQAIYGWRGGDPEILAERAETAHRTVFLGTNYRSGSAIVEATNRLAEKSMAKPKGYVLRAHADQAGIVDVQPHSMIDDDELRSIALGLEAFRMPENDVRDLHGFSSAAVLARTNATLERLGEILEAQGIPFRILGAKRGLLRNPAVRGALAYLRLALNPADDHAFGLALSTPPPPSMTPAAWKYLLRKKAGGSLHSAAGRIAQAQEDGTPWICLHRFLEQVSGLALVDADMVVSPYGWSGVVDDLIGYLIDMHRADGFMGRATALEALRELLGDFVRGKVRGRVLNSLRGFLWFATFGQAQDEIDPDEDAVTLSTIHLAKGLEWPAVFLPAWNEDVLPSSQAQAAALAGQPDKLDEELRLAFVAVSRARDIVVVSHALKRRIVEGGFYVKTKPSRFLAALKAPLPL